MKNWVGTKISGRYVVLPQNCVERFGTVETLISRFRV
jgi:hypothetical protein